MANAVFSKDIIKLDYAAEVDKTCDRIRSILRKDLKKRGIVLGVSGGIDSSVTMALTVKALGKERVTVLQMPERHSADETLYLSGLVADHFGVERIHDDITGILKATKQPEGL